MMDCAAVILAGGFSRRFGGDKARYLWREREFIDHIATALASICSELLIVVRPDQLGQAWPAQKVIGDDLSLPAGPLRGVIAGLESMSAPAAFVTACDSPLIAPALVEGLQTHLIAQSGGSASPVVPEWEGRLQPLLAAYPAAAGPRLRELAAAGEESITGAVKQLEPVIVPEQECRSLDPAGLSFLNINSPEDLELLENLSGLGS